VQLNFRFELEPKQLLGKGAGKDVLGKAVFELFAQPGNSRRIAPVCRNGAVHKKRPYIEHLYSVQSNGFDERRESQSGYWHKVLQECGRQM
jgi:hypothetical protein